MARGLHGSDGPAGTAATGPALHLSLSELLQGVAGFSWTCATQSLRDSSCEALAAEKRSKALAVEADLPGDDLAGSIMDRPRRASKAR